MTITINKLNTFGLDFMGIYSVEYYVYYNNKLIYNYVKTGENLLTHTFKLTNDGSVYTGPLNKLSIFVSINNGKKIKLICKDI